MSILFVLKVLVVQYQTEPFSHFLNQTHNYKWVTVFKSGPSKICGRQPLNLDKYGLVQADHIPSNFLKAVSHKFYLVHS